MSFGLRYLFAKKLTSFLEDAVEPGPSIPGGTVDHIAGKW